MGYYETERGLATLKSIVMVRFHLYKRGAMVLV